MLATLGMRLWQFVSPAARREAATDRWLEEQKLHTRIATLARNEGILCGALLLAIERHPLEQLREEEGGSRFRLFNTGSHDSTGASACVQVIFCGRGNGSQCEHFLQMRVWDDSHGLVARSESTGAGEEFTDIVDAAKWAVSFVEAWTSNAASPS